MSRQQREMVDAMLRRPRPAGPQTVEALRAGFTAMMATMRVPAAVRTETVVLGGRPAVRVQPEQDVRRGTIVYFHGGAYVFGSPQTAMSLTANLVTRTGFQAFTGVLDEADQALARAALFLTQHIHAAPHADQPPHP